jgi:hypothetical protein
MIPSSLVATCSKETSFQKEQRELESHTNDALSYTSFPPTAKLVGQAMFSKRCPDPDIALCAITNRSG